MKRRTALQTMAGLLLSPLFRLSPTQDLHRLLAAWSGDTYRGRLDIGAPFVQLGFAYGTDGRRAMRIKSRPWEEDETAARRLPDMRETWRKVWVPTTSWQPLAMRDIADLRSHPKWKRDTCLLCSEAGDCESCGGGGETLGVDGEARRCYPCDGRGYMPRAGCPMCGGGSHETKRYHVMGGHWFDHKYIRHAADIPGAEAAISEHEGALLLRSDGVEAVIMPMNV